MPAHSPADLAARPAPRSLVLLRPTGQLVAAAALLGVVLVLANALKLAAGHWPGRNIIGELVGLGLLLGAGYQRARGNRPQLLTIGRDALHLAPLAPAQNPVTDIIPLEIVAYTYWLRLLRWRGFAQCHLRLELADGRTLHLADRPGTRPTDPTGTVRLDVLAKRLGRRPKSGPLRRPLFYQTQAARVLLWASWALLAGALGLLGLGYEVSLLLLPPAIIYGCLYYLGRADADLGA